jgi:hypothetical protein
MCVRFSHVGALHLTAAAAIASSLLAGDAFAQDPPPAQDAPRPPPPAQDAPSASPPAQDAGSPPPAQDPPGLRPGPSAQGPAADSPAPTAPTPAPEAPPSATVSGAAGGPSEPAANPEPDVLYRTDGGVLRGTVVEIIPDVEVQIRLATGVVVTIARPYILHFEHLAPAPVEAALPPAAAHVSTGARGWVHIENSEEATLEHAGSEHGWIAVCSSPCDKALPTDGMYRIVGPNLETSRAFALGARGGEYETLHVHGGSHRAVTSGILVLALGVPLSLSLAFSMVGVSRLGSGGPLTPTERTIEQSSLLAGGVAALAGAAMILTNLGTDVSQTVMPAPPTSPVPPYGGGAGASTLGKEARQDARTLGAAIPPAPAIETPLFAVRF